VFILLSSEQYSQFEGFNLQMVWKKTPSFKTKFTGNNAEATVVNRNTLWGLTSHILDRRFPVTKYCCGNSEQRSRCSLFNKVIENVSISVINIVIDTAQITASVW